MAQITRDRDDAENRDKFERRSGRRVTLSFPIEVSGFDESGRIFREVTVTTDVSESGCRFDLLREIKRADVIAIQLAHRDGSGHQESKPLLFEVAWVYPSDHGWTVGASKLHGENMWPVQFPIKKTIIDPGK